MENTSFDNLKGHLAHLSKEMDGILEKLRNQADLPNGTLITLSKRYVDLQGAVHFVGTYCNHLHPPKIVTPPENGAFKIVN